MVYHIIVLFCLFAILLSNFNEKIFSETLSVETKNTQLCKIENTFYFILVIYMIALCGFRAYGRLNHVGIDTNAYYKTYLEKNYMQWSYIMEKDINDKGYTILQYILMKLGFNFLGLQLLSAVIYIGPIVVYIYKYSQNRWISVLLFVSIELYTFGFSGMRQGLAMGLCMIAYLFSQRAKGVKGFLLFVFFTWLASTIHASALVFLPVYILQRLPYKKSIIFIFLAIAALTMIFKRPFANMMVQLAATASDKYESYKVAESMNAGTKLYLFVLMTIILKLVMNNSLSENVRKDNSIYLILMMLILFPAVQSGNAMLRIHYYYFMFFGVYLANTLEGIEDTTARHAAYLLLSLFLVYFYITSDMDRLMLLPYQFFWQG